MKVYAIVAGLELNVNFEYFLVNAKNKNLNNNCSYYDIQIKGNHE